MFYKIYNEGREKAKRTPVCVCVCVCVYLFVCYIPIEEKTSGTTWLFAEFLLGSSEGRSVSEGNPGFFPWKILNFKAAQ